LALTCAVLMAASVGAIFLPGPPYPGSSHWSWIVGAVAISAVALFFVLEGSRLALGLTLIMNATLALAVASQLGDLLTRDLVGASLYLLIEVPLIAALVMLWPYTSWEGRRQFLLRR
jgi:hypothetical protein